MAGHTRSCAKQKFTKFLGEKKLRLTTQRRAIVDTVFGTSQHFTAEELLEWARERDPSVSRATVYRTLPLLTESGLVRVLDLGKDRTYYDPNYADSPDHSHIICEDCQKIVEFESSRIDELENEISRRLGFSVSSRQLQLTAKCEELRRRGACDHKSDGKTA